VSLLDQSSQTVAVVLPCLNEREAVAVCVRQARDALAAGGLDGDVIVVDNGSTDGSAEVAAAAGARSEPVAAVLPGGGLGVEQEDLE